MRDGLPAGSSSLEMLLLSSQSTRFSKWPHQPKPMAMLLASIKTRGVTGSIRLVLSAPRGAYCPPAPQSLTGILLTMDHFDRSYLTKENSTKTDAQRVHVFSGVHQEERTPWSSDCCGLQGKGVGIGSMTQAGSRLFRPQTLFSPLLSINPRTSYSKCFCMTPAVPKIISILLIYPEGKI